MVDPRRSDDVDRLATLVHCFLAEGTGAGVGLLGALRATGLLAEPQRDAAGQQEPVDDAVSS